MDQILNRDGLVLCNFQRFMQFFAEVWGTFAPSCCSNCMFLGRMVLIQSEDMGSRLQSGFPLSLEVPEDDRFVDDKLDILDINGFQGSQEFMLTTSEEPTVDLLAYLRLINLSGKLSPHTVFALVVGLIIVPS